jgi:hypothetical protein
VLSTTIRKSATTVAALGALGLGGAAIAGATDNPTSSQERQARPQRDSLSGDAAAKVEAAALEKVPGAMVLRTEAGGPYDTPYHAHIETSDGTPQVVLVNTAFEATAVEADRGRGARGRDGRGDCGRPGAGPGGRGETALAGETKRKVEAAVRTAYPRATLLRTETNGDSRAPHESHVRTRAGQELEVLVSRDFEVIDAREHRGRP